MQKGFLYIFFSHTDFSPKIQIFLVVYTDFVRDQSGRPDFVYHNLMFQDCRKTISPNIILAYVQTSKCSDDA